jgi:PhnB protein
MQIAPYLYFKGACESALQFYESCGLGGIGEIRRYAGTPAVQRFGPEWADRCCIAFSRDQEFGSTPRTDRILSL